jgi:hydroxyacylglutathione hydrolase
MPRLEVELLTAFADNYIYLLRESGGAVGIVDAGDAAPAIAALDARALAPTHIFNTHHHPDHIGGNAALKRRFPEARLVGPAAESGRIADMDVRVVEGEQVRFGDLSFQVIAVPGHTRGHIAFWSDDGEAVFSGDTLFALGCGRLFEGTPDQMWRSLCKLRDLPLSTRVFCGHEYTQSNARFARTVDPLNEALAARSAEIDRLRANRRPTIPSTIGLERGTNPFLRADDPAIAAAIGLEGADPVAVFAEIRGRKDRF